MLVNNMGTNLYQKIIYNGKKIPDFDNLGGQRIGGLEFTFASLGTFTPSDMADFETYQNSKGNHTETYHVSPHGVTLVNHHYDGPWGGNSLGDMEHMIKLFASSKKAFDAVEKIILGHIATKKAVPIAPLASTAPER